MSDNEQRPRKRILRRSHILKASKSFECNLLHQQRTVSSRITFHELICCICQGPAHGYNFDVISCESCKAFFRRNALKQSGTFQCRNNDGQCIINISTRKRCKACRLAKCFDNGMRADWILTDAERSIKRQKIEENRQLRQMLYPDSPDDTDETHILQPKTEPVDFDEDTSALFNTPLTSSPISTLTSEDLTKIHQIQQAYIDSVRLTSLPPGLPSYPQTVRLTETTDVINLPTNMHATRLITFFKLIPEFSLLNDNDKLILTKYNTLALITIRAALNYDPLTDIYHEPNTHDCIFAGRDIIDSFDFEEYKRITRCVRNFVYASMNDRFILQIYLIIMLFSKGSFICTDMKEMEPIAQDILSIHQLQNIFIELLWKYCENKFGFTKTVEIYLKLTKSSIDAYWESFYVRKNYFKFNETSHQLAPLMKSVLLII